MKGRTLQRLLLQVSEKSCEIKSVEFKMSDSKGGVEGTE